MGQDKSKVNDFLLIFAVVAVTCVVWLRASVDKMDRDYSLLQTSCNGYQKGIIEGQIR